MPKNGRPCKPLMLTRRQAQLLINSCGSRIEKLTQIMATGVITGQQLVDLIDEYKVMLLKLEECTK